MKIVAPATENNLSYGPGTAGEFVYVRTRLGRERSYRPEE